MSVTVIPALKAEEKRIAYQLRYKMMCQDLKWLPDEGYVNKEEQDEYDKNQSLIFLALDEYGNCIGTSRLILQGDIALPVELNFDLYPREFRLLKMIGYTLAEIGESKLYMGSKTTPGVLALNNLLPELKINKPSLYDYLTADGDMVREKALV